MCYPKEAGGWNIINLELWNKAAICKQLWNVLKKKDKIWVRWIHGYYMKQQDWKTMPIPSQAAWVVKKILGARDYMATLPDGDTLMEQDNFSIKKLYIALRGTPKKRNWHHMISKSIAAPKCLFILWLAIMKRMTTCDRLQKFGIQCDQACCLCSQGNESLNHLFFVCPYSANVWDKLAMWCGVQRKAGAWDDEVEYLERQGASKTGKQLMYRLLVATIVYHIWRERNERRFNSKASHAESVVRQCQLMMVVRGELHPKVHKMFVN
ncbi:uncharacterized protein LOC131015733 [Salvia miltiorrhiza]|uniref:uncharacterized protein LOC131015733 n=1 Tax=Salvia miltiorrhiza TaxID=226208 RepID=UPI0025AD67CB|nr:uncharacterized protein LOC131015733 [Salvia miltiorrhiza]